MTRDELRIRLEEYRRDLIRELGYSHWGAFEKIAFKLALKWFNRSFPPEEIAKLLGE